MGKYGNEALKKEYEVEIKSGITRELKECFKKVAREQSEKDDATLGNGLVDPEPGV